MSDIPKTWDDFIDFFKPCRIGCAIRACATPMRRALSSARSAVDPVDTFSVYSVSPMAAQDLVTSDGKLHADDPQVGKR